MCAVRSWVVVFDAVGCVLEVYGLAHVKTLGRGHSSAAGQFNFTASDGWMRFTPRVTLWVVDSGDKRVVELDPES